MARRGAHLDGELIGALDDLALHLVVADAIGVSAAVRARLVAEDTAVWRDGLRSVRTRTRVLVGAAVIVLVVSAALAMSSATRDAVADFFGLRGVQIEQQHGSARSCSRGRSRW